MKKRRLLAIVMAMMMVVAFGMTSMAASGRNTYVEGVLTRAGIAGAKATTTSTYADGDKVCACVTVEYMSSVGNTYTSSPVKKNGNGSVVAQYLPTGSFVSAWSYHGRFGKEFSLYL